MTPDRSVSGTEQSLRECAICGDVVKAGIIGMSNHIELEHTQQDIVEAVSKEVDHHA